LFCFVFVSCCEEEGPDSSENPSVTGGGPISLQFLSASHMSYAVSLVLGRVHPMKGLSTGVPTFLQLGMLPVWHISGPKEANLESVDYAQSSQLPQGPSQRSCSPQPLVCQASTSMSQSLPVIHVKPLK
jgi:hypothetical protein